MNDFIDRDELIAELETLREACASLEAENARLIGGMRTLDAALSGLGVFNREFVATREGEPMDAWRAGVSANRSALLAGVDGWLMHYVEQGQPTKRRSKK